MSDNSATQLTVVSESDSMVFVMPPHVAAVVPFKDHADYERLSLDQKKRLSQLISIFSDIESSPDGIVVASDRLGIANGTSGSNLRTLRSKFKKRGWRALAKIYRGPGKLPDEFIQEVRRRIENNSRGTRAAIVQLKDDWADGKSIPGYGTWREYFQATRPLDDIPERYPFGFYPEGWGESNLYTKQSTKAERAYKRIGRAATQRYLPHVVRDTSQLRPLELITIDDFELDFLVRAFNPVSKRWEICRCAGLLAIDVATRRKLAVAIIPRFRLSKRERALADQHIAANADLIEGEAETTEEKRTRIAITRHDVQSLLHAVFSTHGRPHGYGCTILCENASAAITTDFELALELLLGVQVARTGLINEKTLRNGFVQGGGKPWEKGWIESLFNLLWNRAGSLVGQKGSSYERKPADHEAKVAYAMGLYKLDGLPPEVAAKLRVQHLSIDETLAGLDDIFNRIENRTDHKMIGFDGRFIYRLPGAAGFVREDELGDATQEQLIGAEVLEIRESPVERWDRLMPQVQRVKIADYILACLLLTPKKVALKNHRLSFIHAGQGYTFADADSPVMKMAEGTELLGYFDHRRPSVLHVTDLRGAYIGCVRRRGAIDIRDHAAISAEAGEITRMIRTLVINPVRERHAAEDAQLLADREHNAALVAPYLPPPKAEASASNGISAKLARAQAPARDGSVAGEQLAAAISQHVGKTDAAAVQRARVRADAERLTPEEIAAATGNDRPESSETDQQFSSDEISDLLRD